MDNQRFLYRVRQACRAEGMTVSQVETALGWSQGLISRWSKTSPSVEKLIELVNFLDVSYESLLDDEKISADAALKKDAAEKLARMTENGVVVWTPCGDDSEAAELIASLAVEDCLVDEAYCYSRNGGRFFLIMAEEGAAFTPRLYVSAGSGLRPQQVAASEKYLGAILMHVDRALYDSWQERKTNQFLEEFLNETD